MKNEKEKWRRKPLPVGSGFFVFEMRVEGGGRRQEGGGGRGKQ